MKKNLICTRKPLSFSRVSSGHCNINNQALPFYLIQYHTGFRLAEFNLVDSLYFEVPQLLVSGFIHLLWLMVVIFFIPVIGQLSTLSLLLLSLLL